MKNEIIENENNEGNNLNNNDKIYRFILIDNGGNIFLIKAFSKNKINIKYKIELEQSMIEIKDIENNFGSISGVISIYIVSNRKTLDKIVDCFQKIEIILKKEKIQTLFPKFILGNQKVFKNSIKKEKEKDKNNIMNNIIYLEGTEDSNICINMAIDAYIKLKKENDIFEKFIADNKINEKQIINNLNKSKINLIKCLKCQQIYELSFDQLSSSVLLYCRNCKSEKKLDIFSFEKLIKDIKCNVCKKNINQNSINYCFKCQKSMCQQCTKSHSHNEEEINDYIYPSNLINIICNVHNKLCYKYCNKCKKNICLNCEVESHINHENIIYDAKKICKLIFDKKKSIKLEKDRYKKIRDLIDDCLNSLKKYFDKFISYKEQELKIKEDLVQEFEIFKYDKTMIENINNLKFGFCSHITFNNNDSWEKKMQNIFEFFNEPIKIKKTKLCLKQNLKGPFDILKNIDDIRQNSIIYENIKDKDKDEEKVTDLCSLYEYNNKNHFAVSYRNGILKIFNDDFENRRPINKICEFEPNEGINSIFKLYGKSILLIGNSKIKKINLSDDFKEYNIINEIEVSDQTFNFALEIDSLNSILTKNNFNHIIFYDYENGNELSDITEDININIDQEILFIDRISENKIIMKIADVFDMSDYEINVERKTINRISDKINEDDIDNFIRNEVSYNSLYLKTTKSPNSTLTILEFEKEQNKIKIKKKHSFDKNIDFLGKLNEFLLLLYNNETNRMILFDMASYTNIIDFPFKSIQKPNVSFTLSKRNDILDLLLLCEEGFLCQYILNMKLGIIYEIAKIKIDILNEKQCQLVDLDNRTSIEKLNDDKNENGIIKMVNLSKSSYLIITRDNNIYNLKNYN